MEKDDKRFSREEIEAQTERSHSRLPQEEHRLVQDLYTLSQDYARENDRSFERVWSRLLQVQQSSPEPLQHSQDASEHKVLPMKGKGMHPNDSQWETVSSTLRSHGAKPHKSPRRPFKRLLGVGLCAAILTLVVGWALIFSGFHTNPQAPSSRVGSSNVQSAPRATPTPSPQSSVSSDPLCSFTAHGPQHLNYNTEHSLSWASKNTITTTAGGLVTYDVSTCQKLPSSSMQAQQAYWSPDGKRLLLLSIGVGASILDAQGNVLVTHSMDPASLATAATGIVPLASLSGDGSAFYTVSWSPDGTKVASVFILNSAYGNKSGVEIWNANTGAHEQTLSCPNDQGESWALGPLTIWSSNGKYLVGDSLNGNRTCVWNTQNGQLVTSIPVRTGDVNDISPDGKTLLLVNTSERVQIYDLATRQVLSTFTVKDSAPHSLSAAWSPNGAYLAVTGQNLHILRVSDGTEVTIYRSDFHTEMRGAAWSPDSSMVATVATDLDEANPDGTFKSDGFVKIWRVK